jgi:hypothetical protein
MFSVAALAEESEAAALLARIAALAPGVVFHDELAGEVVRVHGSVERLAERSPHVGASIGSFDGELLWLFEDHGDVLVPGWTDATEVMIGDEPRTIVSVESMLEIVGEHLNDSDFVSETEEETLAFLRDLRRWLETALSERLPISAAW